MKNNFFISVLTLCSFSLVHSMQKIQGQKVSSPRSASSLSDDYIAINEDATDEIQLSASPELVRCEEQINASYMSDFELLSNLSIDLLEVNEHTPLKKVAAPVIHTQSIQTSAIKKNDRTCGHICTLFVNTLFLGSAYLFANYHQRRQAS